MVTRVTTKIITVSITSDLLKEIDEAAKASYESRSDYLRRSAIMRLKDQRMTKWPQAEVG
ncbi:MAG: ribbon-helix-helix protein, CopG family [Patescibacteria group bacterium]